jgi:hypothetical protein
LRALIYAALEKKLQNERDRQHFRLLRATEEGRLEARGINLLTARRKGQRIAKAMIATAAQWRDEEKVISAQGAGPTPLSPSLVERLKIAAEHPEPVLEPHERNPSALSRSVSKLLGFLLGRTLRFLLGAWLLVILAVWLDARGIVKGSQVQDQAAEISRVVGQAAKAGDPALLGELSWKIPLDWGSLEQPIDTIFLPRWLRGRVMHFEPLAANAGVAGLGLLLSTFWGRRWTGFFALLSAFLVLSAARMGVVSTAFSGTVSPQAQARLLGLLVFLVAVLPKFRGRVQEPLPDQESR